MESYTVSEEWLKALNSFLSRAHFERREDEIKAAQFGESIKNMINGEACVVPGKQNLA